MEIRKASYAFWKRPTIPDTEWTIRSRLIFCTSITGWDAEYESIRCNGIGFLATLMNPTPPIRKIQYALAVARELHFRRAADRLNISQPFLSRQIRELEAAIGFDIFRRDPVSLTEPGRVFVVRARQMMEVLEADFRGAIEASHAVSHRNARDFLVAHSAYVPIDLRVKIRSIQRATFPNIRLGFRILFALDLLEALDAGQIRAGITFGPLGRSDLVHIILRSEHLCAVFPKVHPLSARPYIFPSDLNDEPLISAGTRRTHPVLHQWLIEQAVSAGCHPVFVEEATFAHEAFDLVQGGVGVAILPQGVCQNAPGVLRCIPIRGLKPLEMVLVHRSDRDQLTQRIVSDIMRELTAR